MNIAHLVPYTTQFPLKNHNGRYEWVLRIARLQVLDGHNVTIYSDPGSHDPDSNISWKSSDYNFNNKTLNNLASIKTALQEPTYDIHHSHFDYLHYFLADTTNKPLIFTQHWFPTENIAATAKFNVNANVLAVPGSSAMARENKRMGIPSAEIIRQGIDLSLFKFSPKTTNDRLIFVGRIAPWKGVLEAVQIARSANQKLDIVGKLNNAEMGYWKKIEPLVDGDQIKYLGPKSQVELALLIGNAKALIFPSQAPEASVQVPIEAQACGTPVIINNMGATPEWVDHGKTGFIVQSDSEYIEAINKISSIDRQNCRQFAERFDIKLMIKKYDHLYNALIDNSGQATHHQLV